MTNMLHVFFSLLVMPQTEQSNKTGAIEIQTPPNLLVFVVFCVGFWDEVTSTLFTKHET